MAPIGSESLSLDIVVPFAESTEILQVLILELQCLELLLCFVESVNGEVA